MRLQPTRTQRIRPDGSVAVADANLRLISVLAHEIAITEDWIASLTESLRLANHSVPAQWSEATRRNGFNMMFSVLHACALDALIWKESNQANPARFPFPQSFLPYLKWDSKMCRQAYHALLDHATVPIGKRQNRDACLHFSKPTPRGRPEGVQNQSSPGHR